MADASEPSTSDALEALLDRAERLLQQGDFAAAVDTVGAAASQLGAVADHPHSLGRAAWLAALISLLEGDRDGFYRHSEGAIASLRFAGDEAAVRRVALAGADLGSRSDDYARVREHGAVGLLQALARSTSLLLDIASDGVGESDARWQLVDRDRDEIPDLLSMVTRLTGQPSPLERLVRAYSLDSIESVLFSVLGPLSAFDVLSDRYNEIIGTPRSGWFSTDGLARLLFTRQQTRLAARSRLDFGGRLHRERLIDVSMDPPCVRLAVGVGSFLHGGWVSPAGGSVTAVEIASPRPGRRVVPPLAEARRTLERLLASADGGLLVALIGPSGSGRVSLIRAAAATAGRRVLTVRLGAVAADLGGVLDACRRDALLHAAVIHVDLPDGVVPEPLLALLGQPGPTWLLTLPHTVSSLDRDLLRHERPDLVELEVGALELEAQAGLWSALLSERGCQAPRKDDLELEVCRPGLVIGDLIIAIERVLGERRAAGRSSTQIDAAELGDALTASLLSEMARLAEPMAWAGEEDDDEDDEEDDDDLLGDPARQLLIEVAESVERGRSVLDEMGVNVHASSLLRPVVVHAFGNARAREQLISFLASSIAMPPFRVDLEPLASKDAAAAEYVLAPIFEAAGRLGAILVLEPIESLLPPKREGIARALARQIDRALTSVVLSGSQENRLPASLAAHVEWSIATDPESS